MTSKYVRSHSVLLYWTILNIVLPNAWKRGVGASIYPPSPTVKHISFRKLKTLDLTAFKGDIALIDLFNNDADPEKLVDS